MTFSSSFFVFLCVNKAMFAFEMGTWLFVVLWFRGLVTFFFKL